MQSGQVNNARAAVFWDAENVTFKGEPAIAAQFRLWLTGHYDPDALFAFADWNGPYRDLGKVLYKIGFDLIHVPDALKDSADCSMAAYMIDWLIRSPETKNYIIVSGDAVFEPLALALKKQGKRVIIVSNPMITRAETVLRADEYVDIDSFRPAPSKIDAVTGEKDRELSPDIAREVAFRRLRETIAKLRNLGKSTPIRYVEAVVRHLNPGLKIGDEGYDSWDQIINQALAENLVALRGEEPFEQLILTDKEAKIQDKKEATLDEAMNQFVDIVRKMYEKGEYTGMEAVVHKVRDAHIDYLELGYSRFGDFARAAESRDLIRIVDQEERPPVLKPVYSFDAMLDWYKKNTKRIFGKGARVPNDPFVHRTIRMLYKYDVSMSQMESFLKDKDVQEKYHAILDASGLSFIPPYEQVLISILFGLDWNCKETVEIVNEELEPLGYEVECP